MIAVAAAAAEGGPYQHSFGEGLRQALEMIVEANPLLVQTTLRTLRLAFETTLIASLVGMPTGCIVGIGSFRGRGVLLGMFNAFARVPPVVVGLFGLLMIVPASPWGGGPLSELLSGTDSEYFVQTLVALPIVTVLTAAAVQTVPASLLGQARAFGASRPRVMVLAIREARLAVFAAALIALGVTITAVGALIVVRGPLFVNSTAPLTLAVGALLGVRNGNGAEGLRDAVAYATILFGLFILLAAALTSLQYGSRRSAS